MAIPALVAVTLALLWAIALGVTHLRVDEAAYAAARLAARGAGSDAVQASVQSRLASAEVHVSVLGETVSVTVTEQMLAGVPILRGLSTSVTATSVVAIEGS